MRRLILGSICLLALFASAAQAKPHPGQRSEPGGVQFRMKRIGNCRSEACAVADFNRDGKLDILAGPYLYLAPDFKPQHVCTVKSDVDNQGRGYAHDFHNLLVDVNGDGKLDVISGDWHSRALWWNENTLPAPGIWPRHEIDTPGNIETGLLVDLDGDGKATDLLPDTQTPCAYTLAKGGKIGGFFNRLQFESKGCDSGRGCGDLNGDGLPDVLTAKTWYEQRRDHSWQPHKLHIGFDVPNKFGHASNLIVTDINRDGRADILVSAAHGYGIFWCEQRAERDAHGDLTFTIHKIDDTWTQAHYLAFADIDNDGVNEIITGKRFFAHNGLDPDGRAPLGIFYYDYTPGPNPTFHKHTIAWDIGIGAGMNIVCADMDQDGDLDLVTTGKYGGPVVFENLLK